MKKLFLCAIIAGCVAIVACQRDCKCTEKTVISYYGWAPEGDVDSLPVDSIKYVYKVLYSDVHTENYNDKAKACVDLDRKKIVDEDSTEIKPKIHLETIVTCQ